MQTYRQKAGYDVTETDQFLIFEEFSKIRKYGCFLAAKANLAFSTPSWQSGLTLEENLALGLRSLNDFIEHQESDELDAWVFTITDSTYALDLATLSKTLKRILSFLSTHDPSASNIMDRNIETPEWEFC